jgi:hypothetical protein
MFDTKTKTAPLADLSKSWPHMSNRKVQIDYRAQDNFYLSICPNPFISGVAQNNGTGIPGVAIIIVCDTIAQQYTGNVTIFDAIGNVVLRDKKMQAGTVNDLWLSYVWDTKDEKSRDVGRGVYFVNVTVTNKNDGKKKRYGEKIGVMRALAPK